MKTLLTIALLLLLSTSFGQGKANYGLFSPRGDTSFWYGYLNKIRSKISLPKLDTSSKPEYYRVWTSNQVIDIYNNQDGKMSGVLTTWTDEHTPNNEPPTLRTFFKSHELNIDTATLIRGLFIASNILKLPTDDSISGWHHGFDGVIYSIEYSTKDSYYFKSYWTPSAQDSLNEARQVQSFVDSAFSLANANNIWKLFVPTIPFEYYGSNGMVAIRVLTKKERKKYFEERQNYRQHRIGAMAGLPVRAAVVEEKVTAALVTH